MRSFTPDRLREIADYVESAGNETSLEDPEIGYKALSEGAEILRWLADEFDRLPESGQALDLSEYLKEDQCS